MKYLILLIVLISTPCFSGEESVINFYNPYVKSSVGLSSLSDEKFENNISSLPSPLKIKTDYSVGYYLDLGFGIGIVKNIREELEFSYIYNSIDKVGGNSINSRQRTFATMFNTIYDFNDANLPFIPYVGGGFGLVSTRVKGKGMNLSDDSIGYQVLLGGTYKLQENVFLDVGYKYLASEHSDIVASGTNKVKFDNDYHIIKVGINYKF